MKTFCKLTAQSPAASYVPLPRFLLQDEALRDISNDAKVLYALLLDRASISRQNGYVEPDGTIRLYFTLEQAQTKLHRSRQSATRIFRELEYSGLIIRKKQGLGTVSYTHLDVYKRQINRCIICLIINQEHGQHYFPCSVITTIGEPFNQIVQYPLVFLYD